MLVSSGHISHSFLSPYYLFYVYIGEEFDVNISRYWGRISSAVGINIKSFLVSLIICFFVCIYFKCVYAWIGNFEAWLSNGARIQLVHDAFFMPIYNNNS